MLHDKPASDFDPGLDSLIRLAAGGDGAAMHAILGRHRGRLRRLIASRIDGRLSSRVDPSDIVQEALIDATRGLADYERRRPLPFYPWLCQLAHKHLIQAYRRNVGAARRGVGREEDLRSLLDESGGGLIGRLVSGEPGPGQQVCDQERRERLRRAVEGLDEADRTILRLRYRENQQFRAIAETVGLGDGAVKMRHLRALRQLRAILGDSSGANLDGRRVGHL